jgi:sugar (pentulose or hexulose) kinase
MSGGAAQMKVWNEIKASAWGRPCRFVETPQTGALGAAMLAAVGVGVYRDCEEAARGMARVGTGPSPDAESSHRYRNAYGHFCKLYPTLRDQLVQIYGESTEAHEPMRPCSSLKT